MAPRRKSQTIKIKLEQAEEPDDIEIFEVEKILDKRVISGKVKKKTNIFI